MGAVLGIIGPRSESSKLRRAAETTAVTSLFLLGLVLPLIWMPYLAVVYRKATLRLGGRAAVYYTGSEATSGTRARRTARVPKATGVLSLLRLFAFSAIPVGLTALVMLLGPASPTADGSRG